MDNRTLLQEKNRKPEILTPPKPTSFLIFFWIFALLEVAASFTDFIMFHITSEILMIPILMLFLFYYPVAIEEGKKKIMLGLVFSWLGNTTLIIEPFSPIFFIISLIFFLAACMIYTHYFIFLKENDSEKISFIRQQPWWVSVVVLYGIFFVWWLYPYLKNAKLPIIIFTIVICCMLIAALHIWKKLNKPSGLLYLLGSIFLLISGSLVAVDRFYYPIPYCAAIVILVYATSQYCIVKGFVKLEEDKHPYYFYS